MKSDLVHRLFGYIGYGGGAGVFAMSWTEVELAIRIVVGLLSIASITIHLAWSWSDRKKKK